MCGNAPRARKPPRRPAALPSPAQGSLTMVGRPRMEKASGSPKRPMNRISVRCAGLVLALAACIAPVGLGHAQDAPVPGQPLDLRPRPPAPKKKPKPASQRAKPAEAPARYMALPAEPTAKPAVTEK